MLKLEIIVHPSCSEPELPVAEAKSKFKSKWRASWRTRMLARPKPPAAHKYVPPPPRVFNLHPSPLDPETEFRSEQIARPPIRTLTDNKKLFKFKGPSYVKRMMDLIEKTWCSMYNYYRKKFRDRRLKRLEKKMKRLEAKKPKGKDLEKLEEMRKEHIQLLATPKKLFLPEVIPRKRKLLEDLQAAIDALAMPKERHILPPREIGVVKPSALAYEITETIMKLAQVPESKKRRPSDDYNPFTITRAALRAKCTPLIEKLAQPSLSRREAKKQEEDKYDPWTIPPNVLKYKATPRILELAKPIERD